VKENDDIFCPEPQDGWSDQAYVSKVDFLKNEALNVPLAGYGVGVWVGIEYTIFNFGCLLAVPSSLEEYLIIWFGPVEYNIKP